MPRKPAQLSVAEANPAPGGVAAVDRAASLLAAFRLGDQALSLTDFAERTGLYKSTVLRLLASLEHAGLIQRLADGGYVLGNDVARLHRIYTSTFSLDRIVIPALQALVHQTGESAAYHVIQGEARLCRYRVDSPHPVRDHVRPGDMLPLERGAGGRVLVAFSGELTGKQEKGKEALYAQIREQGYFASSGDRSAEVAGISAPVFGADGQIAAAVTLTMPAHRYTDDHIQPTIRAAREITRHLGGPTAEEASGHQ